MPDKEADSAAALIAAMGLLVRRSKQVQAPGELTASERSALSRLDRGGAMSSAALAKLEQISPQSMGATVAALEAAGMIVKRPDPQDGRKALLEPTEAGLRLLHERRSARAQALTRAIKDGFTPEELRQLADVVPLLERLAERL
jgi:DNA-binding MarR family transcriptional regulator